MLDFVIDLLSLRIFEKLRAYFIWYFSLRFKQVFVTIIGKELLENLSLLSAFLTQNGWNIIEHYTTEESTSWKDVDWYLILKANKQTQYNTLNKAATEVVP